MYIYGHKIKTIAIKEILVQQSSCNCFSELIHEYQKSKQIRKWLEAGNDQQTAKKEKSV